MAHATSETIQPLAKEELPVLVVLGLGLINILFGALQLSNLSSNAPSHYLAQPLPIVSHIVGGIVLNLLGAFQLSRRLRTSFPAWHRWAGRLVILAGIIIGLSSVYMNASYPDYGTWLKFWGVLVFGVALPACLIGGVVAIRHGKVDVHRRYMVFALAIGLGPATQRLIMIPSFLLFGMPPDWLIGTVIWVGFLVNLLVGRAYLKKAEYSVEKGLKLIMNPKRC